MCDASDFAIGVVLGQREDGKPYVIYYASKTLNEAQRNYTTIEKELLAVVFTLDKFHAYLVGSFIIVFTNHSALNYLLTKQDAKVRLIRWILLLQEFDLQIKEKKGVENVVADHLSRLAIAHNSHVLPINDDFPEESLMLLEKTPWYAHIANYLVTSEVPSEWKAQDRKYFFAKIHAYYWEEPFLFKYCADQIIRKRVPEEEQQGIPSHCHENACGGHFASQKTTMKVLQSGFTWLSLFKDAYIMCRSCDRCQRLGKLTKRNQMPMNPILIVDLFDVWGIDFMGPFPMSFGNSYILVGVDYVSKWVEEIPYKHNDHRVVLKFLKENIFSRFGVPKAIISDGEPSSEPELEPRPSPPLVKKPQSSEPPAKESQIPLGMTLETSARAQGFLPSAIEVPYGALVDSQGFFLSPRGIGLLSVLDHKPNAPPHLPDSAPQRRYHTRRVVSTPVAPTQIPARSPPTKKAKTSESGESSRAPRDSQSQPPPTRRPILTSSPIEGNSDCRARTFHVEAYFDHHILRQQLELGDSYILLERYHLVPFMTPPQFFYPRVALDFYQSMTTRGVPTPASILFTIDGCQGILGVRQIAEAFHIPYAPADPAAFRRWAPLSEWDMVRILSRGTSSDRIIMRKELPFGMLLVDVVLRTNLFPLQHRVQR
ncbi:hypothetical protein VitviT2T_008581 [Vitis vinifera]|uniref:Integrase catalytic domain-containing protein n=1 Tax=Vitis vinifera TaxID=29760 RepID=A0ABY9C2C7_VITVI|nr:hypothetical protein VitviT2T_008581 [Vitis vinifera]